jgi:hypothetical protein
MRTAAAALANILIQEEQRSSRAKKDAMDGTVIEFVTDKLQWLIDHPEVTWSGSGIYALSLAGSTVLVVASCMFRRRKNSAASTTGNQAPAVNAQTVTITYADFSPDVLADVRKLAVTDAALASFFKILKQEQVPRGDLDSKLREIAFRHKELAAVRIALHGWPGLFARAKRLLFGWLG